MAATGAVQPPLSLVAQTCHGTREHAIPNPGACGIKKRGVSAAFPYSYAASLRLRLRLQAGVRIGSRARLAGGRYCGGARRSRLQHRLAVGFLAVEQVLNLVAAQRLELEQALCKGFEVLALLGRPLTLSRLRDLVRYLRDQR